MELKKVYKATEDLFDSADSIYQLFDVYFDSASKQEFYTKLRDTESNFAEAFVFPIADASKFLDQNNETHCILFNKWLNDIRRINGLSVDEKNKFFERVSDASHEIKSNITKDGIINSYRVKTAFNKISNRVKKIGTVSSIKQIDAFKDSFKDADVARVMEILDYYSTEAFENVMNIKTNRLLTDEPRKVRNSVFLAVVPQALDVYEVVNEYLKKCIKCNIPYDIDIPYDKNTKRLVKINSTIDNLGKNIVVLNEIAKEHPEIIKRMNRPPLLCGQISNARWMGIGTYSSKEIERGTFGYTEKRASIIYDVIEKSSKQFIIDKYKKPFKYGDKDKKLKDHIADIATNLCIGKIRANADDYYDAVEENHTPEEAEEQVKSYFGFNRMDLYTPKYIKKLTKSITSDVDRMIALNFEDDPHYNSFVLPNPGFGAGRMLHMEIMPFIIRKVTSEIAIKDPYFLCQTVLDIQSKLQEQGINKKTCYEDYVADKLIESSKETEEVKAEQTIKPVKKKDDREETR